ncbi:MAG TPA: GH92 family glycosyl hydrolase [Verrucomicrobiae bacterium]|jgi:predicted alpha-1,2-mannosidase|nr:GH92 family glycosyl hydrolase [Verrucomicrobiae bacterium]
MTRHLPLKHLAISILLCALAENSFAQKTPVEYANPLVGTASLDDPALLGNAPPPGEETYSGFTYPGPALPHHDIILGPINKDLTEAAGNHGIIYPYVYARRTMLGFSSPMPRLTIMPVVGDWNVPPDRAYASPYDKTSEKASPGYYSVFFPDSGVRTELTTSERTGFYRFTFPKSERGTMLIDLGAGESEIEITGDHTVRGRGRRDGRGFVAEFSKPFKSFGVFRQNRPQLEGSRVRRDDFVNPGARSISGSYAGTYLEFSTTEGEQILVRITTGRTYEAAQQQLDTESHNFDEVHQRARDAWSEKLNLIQVEGGSEKERGLFYSTLYNSLLTPRLIVKKGDRMRGGDTQNIAEYDRYSPIAFWDTGRNQIVLLTLLEPDVKTNILRTHLEMARESGWMHTSFYGDHAVFMYLGDWERGLPFDYASVYEYLRKNAMDPAGPRGDLAEYLKNGWVHDDFQEHPSPPYAGGHAGVDKTLEYSWDDYAMALFAKKLGKDDDYKMFLARAHNYTNVFDPSTGFMRGKNPDGTWISPYDPNEPYYNYMTKEASGWQNFWLVPHDVQGLINLVGGRENFLKKLDAFFNTPYHPQGIARDVTGMIGLYCQGNQPDQQTAYYYDYAGQPWKTQELARKILRLMYGSDKSGNAYPGMDDQGSTSSWYVFSAMGFYTVDPSSPNYTIGSPIFDKVTLRLGNGKTLVIETKNNSEKNLYIQSATLNGKPWNKPWFAHTDIANGGHFIFEMGPQPNTNWGTAPDAAPPSMSN